MTEQSLKDKTAKGLFWGGLSSGTQQIINVIFGIFFARILTQADYGLLAPLSFFTGLVALIQDSGFTAALINKPKIKHEDYNAVFWFSLFVGIITYIILFFCAPFIAAYFNAPELEKASRVMFLWFLIGGATTAHNAMLMKKIMVKERAKILLFTLVISNGIGLFAAISGFNYWALVIQTVLHSVFGTILTWYYSPWRPTFTFNMNPLKDMLPFSIKLLFTGFFSVINNNIFFILLGRFYSREEQGDFSQANKWSILGYSFINTMLAGIVHPILAEIANDVERQRNVFRKLLRFVSFVSFPCLFGLAFVSKELIMVTVGEKWLPCVPIMQLLCIWGAFVPISSLYSSLFISRGKSNINMWNIVGLGILQLIIAIIMLPYGIKNMVAANVLINLLWLFIIQFFAWKTIRLQFSDVLKDIVPFAFIISAIIMLTYLLTNTLNNVYLLLLSKIILVAGLYIFVMKISNAVVFKESLEYLLKRRQ